MESLVSRIMEPAGCSAVCTQHVRGRSACGAGWRDRARTPVDTERSGAMSLGADGAQNALLAALLRGERDLVDPFLGPVALRCGCRRAGRPEVAILRTPGLARPTVTVIAARLRE